jgi:hypothetical protein
MQELGNLDMAMANRSRRELWLNMVIADGSQVANKWLHSHASMMWVAIAMDAQTSVYQH